MKKKEKDTRVTMEQLLSGLGPALFSSIQTNIQIADVLHISAHTVKTHVNSLFNKLGVNDRTQAAVLAARNLLAGDP